MSRSERVRSDFRLVLQKNVERLYLNVLTTTDKLTGHQQLCNDRNDLLNFAAGYEAFADPDELGRNVLWNFTALLESFGEEYSRLVESKLLEVALDSFRAPPRVFVDMVGQLVEEYSYEKQEVSSGFFNNAARCFDTFMKAKFQTLALVISLVEARVQYLYKNRLCSKTCGMKAGL